MQSRLKKGKSGGIQNFNENFKIWNSDQHAQYYILIRSKTFDRFGKLVLSQTWRSLDQSFEGIISARGSLPL